MLIFIYEWVTGGGLINEDLPAGLVIEGELMLKALLHDLSERPDTDIVITRDHRLPALDGPQQTIWIHSSDESLRAFRTTCERADAVWPIAPESDDVLATTVETIQAMNRVAIGSSIDAVKICSSKLHTIQILQARNIPVVETLALHTDIKLRGSGPWVVKPDDGAGCEGSLLVDNINQAMHQLAVLARPTVIQPYQPGPSMSLSLCIADGRARLLGVNQQRIALKSGQFHLTACVVRASESRDKDYQLLADNIADALPGLNGYVGVDFILTDSGPRVLEINPRLTTSYAGLSRACGLNVARLVLGDDGQTPIKETPGKAVTVALQD